MSPSLMAQMNVILTPNPTWTISGILSKIYAAITLIPQVVPFMILADPKRVYPKILAYARAIKADLPEGGKLGVAGFCWGAWPSTKLCVETATADEATNVRLIDAQFNGHPSYIVKTPQMVVDAITKFKVPYTVAVASEDMQFNKAEAEKVEATLRSEIGESSGGAEGGYTYEFRMYEGCVHGFCVRAPVGKQDDVNEQGFMESKRQAIDWFNKYLN